MSEMEIDQIRIIGWMDVDGESVRKHALHAKKKHFFYEEVSLQYLVVDSISQREFIPSPFFSLFQCSFLDLFPFG